MLWRFYRRNWGRVVSTGTPEEVARDPKSYTGQYLARLLGINTKTRKKAKRA
jgi:excinuclease UvrABC ATPase subunit